MKKKLANQYQKKVDEILDKILDLGLDSLSQTEMEYLEAFGKGDTMKMINLEYDSVLKNFESIDGNFKFIFLFSKDFGDDGVFYYGTITVPDIFDAEIGKVEGVIDGYILVNKNNDKIPCFEKDGYDILEFCNGLEYELDNFLDYVIDTLNDEKNNL